METQCPSCNKINVERMKCIRCGCQLEMLAAIIRVAEYECILGREKLKNGKSEEALKHAEQSWHLKKSSNAAKLAFLANIGERKFQEALPWCERISRLAQ